MPPKTNKLERDQKAYISLPRDGSYGSTTYENSGTQTQASLQAAITTYSSMVLAGSEYEDAQTAVEKGKEKGARYVFVPTITNWVHRVAAWSGRASGVSLTVTVFDLSQEGEDLRVMQKDLRVQGRNATFVSQHPGEILKPSLVRFAREIY